MVCTHLLLVFVTCFVITNIDQNSLTFSLLTIVPFSVSPLYLSSLVAEITLNAVEPVMFQGVLQECADEGLRFRLDFASDVRKGPNSECVISVMTEDGSAESEYRFISY